MSLTIFFIFIFSNSLGDMLERNIASFELQYADGSSAPNFEYSIREKKNKIKKQKQKRCCMEIYH